MHALFMPSVGQWINIDKLKNLSVAYMHTYILTFMQVVVGMARGGTICLIMRFL